jgi:hypothetical protein
MCEDNSIEIKMSIYYKMSKASYPGTLSTVVTHIHMLSAATIFFRAKKNHLASREILISEF